MAKKTKQVEATEQSEALNEKMSEGLESVQPFASSRILAESPENLSLVEQVQAHAVLKKVSAAVEARLDSLRAPLLCAAQAQGKVVGDKGTKKLLVEGSSICAQERKANAPNEQRLMELLKSKQLPITEAFEEVSTPMHLFNPSKMQFLLETGKVSKEEYASLFDPPTAALCVYPSKELKNAIASLGLKGKEKQAPQESHEAQPSFEDA